MGHSARSSVRKSPRQPQGISCFLSSSGVSSSLTTRTRRKGRCDFHVRVVKTLQLAPCTLRSRAGVELSCRAVRTLRQPTQSWALLPTASINLPAGITNLKSPQIPEIHQTCSGWLGIHFWLGFSFHIHIHK